MSQFKEYTQKIQEIYDTIAERNKALLKENERLKSEYYKDDELSTMRENTKLLNMRVQHYGITNSDWDKFDKWWKQHLSEDHSTALEMDKNNLYKMPMTPNFKIEIEEFAECTCYSIVCKGCGKAYDVFY